MRLLSLLVRDSIAKQIAALGIVQTPAIDAVFPGNARPDLQDARLQWIPRENVRFRVPARQKSLPRKRARACRRADMFSHNE